VSAGDGPKSNDPEDYVIRSYREGPKMFLKRHCAGPVLSLAAIVYTREAYFADPDVTEAEAERIREYEEQIGGEVTHLLVAVLASSNPGGSSVSPYRFTHNLAGGNNEYMDPSFKVSPFSTRCLNGEFHSDWSGWRDFIIARAKEALEHSNEYSGVAD